MKIVVLHNHVSEDSSPEERDVLVQRDAICDALNAARHHVSSLACTLNLERLRAALHRDRPDVAFNLVESLGGTDRLMSLVPQVLECLDIPFTGSPSAAILETGNKLQAKQRMRQFGLPTPDWHAGDFSSIEISSEDRFILKPVWEHASVGLDEDNVISVTSNEELCQAVRDRSWRHRRPFFAERFVEGREFNLSLLARPSGDSQRTSGLGDHVEVLAPAEIDFHLFPVGKPRIVGYRAKWDDQSFEYQNTPRRFLDTADRALGYTLSQLAVQCWNCFGLRGYARVDFRVDQTGQPWILEVNANPCLAHDAGFVAALERSGWTFPQALDRILQAIRPPHALALP